METLDKLRRQYYEMLARQHFSPEELDHTVMERHQPMLQQLAKVNNSGVTVFDMYRREHVFTSYNFSSLFGYDMEEVKKNGSAYFDTRVHPDDLLALTHNGIKLLEHYYQLPMGQRADYKLINEYRIRNGEDKYVRVIEQHQVLELDKAGNIWLALGVIDLSPDQDEFQEMKSQVLNFRTGEILSNVSSTELAGNTLPAAELTKREKEILGLIKVGLFSKEISDRLSISVHTVNTHRQRILEKLNAGNAMEAVSSAGRLGLLG